MCLKPVLVFCLCTGLSFHFSMYSILAPCFSLRVRDDGPCDGFSIRLYKPRRHWNTTPQSESRIGSAPLWKPQPLCVPFPSRISIVSVTTEGGSYETEIVQEASEDGIWRERECSGRIRFGWFITVRRAGSPNPQACVVIVQLVSTGTG